MLRSDCCRITSFWHCHTALYVFECILTQLSTNVLLKSLKLEPMDLVVANVTGDGEGEWKEFCCLVLDGYSMWGYGTGYAGETRSKRAGHSSR